MGTDPLIGMVVGERYRIESLLGEGGMGAVYRAEHLLIRRKVALKCLRAGLGMDPTIVERFKREALAATAIGSPHIVEVTDMGRFDDGSLFMVMEMLEGRVLSEEIGRLGKLPLERATHIVTQICETLALAHERGIIHRDLKPENVFLITRDGAADYVKILDFGIAKFSKGPIVQDAGMTQSGSMLGTPRFMSPEQFMGAEVDQRTDVYAIGAILYVALTGQAPFEAASFGALLNVVCNAPRPSVRTIRGDVPPELDSVVQRALARDANDRFPSCSEMARAVAMFRNAGGQASLGIAETISAAPPISPPALQYALKSEVALPSAPDVGQTAHAATAPGLAIPQEKSRKSQIAALMAAGTILVAAVAAVALRKPAPPARPEPPSERRKDITPSELNAWVRIDAPSSAHALVLGVPDATAIHVSGFRARRGVRAPLVSYEIQQHEVTWDEYELWLGRSGRSPALPSGVSADREARRHFPAVNVDWRDARSYCRSLGADLPREAEWEFAARGKELRPNPWGDSPLPRGDVNAWRPAGAALVEVMSSGGDRTSGPLATGLFDLVGNAREWTLDVWRADNDGEDESWTSAAGRTYRTVRGLPLVAPTDTTPPQIGAAAREPLCAEGTCPADVATYLVTVGFRCARPAK